MAHQGQTNAGAAVVRLDEQIFQKDVRPRLEGVERVVEQRKADGLPSTSARMAWVRGCGAEQGIAQSASVAVDLVQQAFILRQAADQPQDIGDVSWAWPGEGRRSGSERHG